MAYLDAAAIRARHPDLDEELNPVFTDGLLDGLAAEFAEKLEPHVGVAFEPRTVTGEIHVTGAGIFQVCLNWPKVTSVTEVRITGVAQSTTGMRYDNLESGVLEFPFGIGPGEISIDYVHGFTEPAASVKRACGLFVWHEALATAAPMSSNAYASFNPELGLVERQSTADPKNGRLTGWIDVDRIIAGLPAYR